LSRPEDNYSLNMVPQKSAARRVKVDIMLITVFQKFHFLWVGHHIRMLPEEILQGPVKSF